MGSVLRPVFGLSIAAALAAPAAADKARPGAQAEPAPTAPKRKQMLQPVAVLKGVKLLEVQPERVDFRVEANADAWVMAVVYEASRSRALRRKECSGEIEVDGFMFHGSKTSSWTAFFQNLMPRTAYEIAACGRYEKNHAYDVERVQFTTPGGQLREVIPKLDPGLRPKP